MKCMHIVLATMALVVVGVSSAPVMKRSRNSDQLLDLLSRFLAGNAETEDEQEDEAAVLEEERLENDQIDEVVNKEDDELEEALFKAAQLEKKNDQQLDQEQEAEERVLAEQEAAEHDKKELAILEDIERELLMLDLKEQLYIRPSGGQYPEL